MGVEDHLRSAGRRKSDENVRTVETFLNALKMKDLTEAPIAHDLYFEEPIAGKGRGVEALNAFVSGFFPALSDVRIVQHIAEGDFVVTHWEADGIFGTIPVLEKFCVRNGKIQEFYAFFDPRPIMG